MLEKIKATPGAADAVLTVDIGRLHDMDEAGLLQPVQSKVLEQNIPSSYRHPKGHWFGLTLRGRVIYASKKRVKPGAITRYEDLADPKWKGRICTRSGKTRLQRILVRFHSGTLGRSESQEMVDGPQVQPRP